MGALGKTINLCTLSPDERYEVEMQKQVALARHQCKGMSKREFYDYLRTLDYQVRERIEKLMEAKQRD